MQWKNSDQKFGLVAILLHWIMAFIIIGMVILGLCMKKVPISAFKLQLYGIHKEFGLLILMLVMLRIVWRIWNTLPSLATLPAWERISARIVHYLFYFFMVAMPMTGWLMTSSAGLAPSFFGLFTLPNLVEPNEINMHFYAFLHKWLAYALIATFCLHVAAAIKHHFIDKDNILRRMLP